MSKATWFPLAGLMMLLITGPAVGQSSPQIGLRGGVGTDVGLGLAYGIGGNYALDLPSNSLELGVVFFGGGFEETSDWGTHRYEETTDIIVVGFVANYLMGYAPRQPGLFFITGIGLASISVEWEERSATDRSLGPPLPGGGSMQSDDGTTGGTVFNLGIGRSFAGGMDLRAELPIIVTFAPPGGASSVVPTLMATLGYRF